MAQATIAGYPRIGKHRELKKALERYWSGKIDQPDLAAAAAQIRAENWATQQQAGLDLLPVNDFSLYDQVLDTIALVGAVPPRYGWSGNQVDVDTYFAMARGRSGDHDVPAMEMTKWFDTNYHYIVPELSAETTFRIASDAPFRALAEATQAGVNGKVVLIGPITFLALAKSHDDGFDPFSLQENLTTVYANVISRLADEGASWIQLDEPILSTGLSPDRLDALAAAYGRLGAAKGNARLTIQTSFDHVADAWPTLIALPIDGIGIDLVRGPETLAALKQYGLPAHMTLTAGVVDGRNVWRTDLRAALQTLREISTIVPTDRILVSSSCSLLHVPIDVRLETALDTDIAAWLAFAEQKLDEIVTLARGLNEGDDAIAAALIASDAIQAAASAHPSRNNTAVRSRIAALTDADTHRAEPASARRQKQAARFQLPPLPTTTIGSFPQTPELRNARKAHDTGELTDAQYTDFLKAQITALIQHQEDLGLDVLVHGEPERNDMVQYFGEQLEGIAFTQHGWVQSYGSRYVRPPLIFGDVSRPRPMTVDWAVYAQSLSSKPVKGMLTGPVTILNWSFVRADQPRETTCRQIALAIRDEVADLDAAGIAMIQIDEAALREGMPLRAEKQQHYLDWAVECFRITAGIARPETQIHTHMCYSEFGTIMSSISAMDADVISIENARSGLELLRTFQNEGYDKGIGPGVYDIHSPRVPPVEEMAANLRANLTVLSQEQLWVNPDCGLKTRREAESTAALRNMVAAARLVRAELG